MCPQSLAEHQRSLRRRVVPPFWREQHSLGVRLADVSSSLFRERGTLARRWPKRMGVQRSAEDSRVVYQDPLLLVLPTVALSVW